MKTTATGTWKHTTHSIVMADVHGLTRIEDTCGLVGYVMPDDAALVVAAPDLLAACKAFVSTFCDSDETTQKEYDAYNAACAAIAKAEGK